MKKGLIGVIHSGWQGTVKEITTKLFDHLIHVEQCDPKDFRVQIGAALSQEKFEVDEDVYVNSKTLAMRMILCISTIKQINTTSTIN